MEEDIMDLGVINKVGGYCYTIVCLRQVSIANTLVMLVELTILVLPVDDALQQHPTLKLLQ